MSKPSVWRRSGQKARREGSTRRPVRSASPSVWRLRPPAPPPAAAEAPAKERKKRYYTVEINEAWCKNCGICSAYCPTGTLADGGHGDPRITDMDLCNGCQLCVVRCPDFAVLVVERSNGDGRADE
ncbi:MAG: 4Fe-4S binding protein [Armatimonadota bacterium]